MRPSVDNTRDPEAFRVDNQFISGYCVNAAADQDVCPLNLGRRAGQLRNGRGGGQQPAVNCGDQRQIGGYRAARGGLTQCPPVDRRAFHECDFVGALQLALLARCQ